MANSDIKIALDTYFQDNWTTTGIQYQGEDEPRVAGVLTDPTTLDSFISVGYYPIENESYGFDGTANGRILYSGIYKIFCYAKNHNQVLILADAVKTFLNGKELNDMHVGIGQDGSPNNIGSGFIEILSSFGVGQWSLVSPSEDYLINNYGLTDEEGNFLVDEDDTYILQDF